MTAFNDLMSFQRETEALAQIAGRLGWDQETMMPRGSRRNSAAKRWPSIETVLARTPHRPKRLADWLAVARSP